LQAAPGVATKLPYKEPLGLVVPNIVIASVLPNSCQPLAV